MGAGSSTEQRSPEQPEAGSGAPAEPQPQPQPQPQPGGPAAAAEEEAPGAAGDPAIAAADPATKLLQKNGQLSALNGVAEQEELPPPEAAPNGQAAEVIVPEVGQREAEDGAERDADKELAADSSAVGDAAKDGGQEEMPGTLVEQVPSSDSNLEELAPPAESAQTNDVGFKKVFKFVGFKFTVKKEKSEKPDPAQLLTVRKEEGEGAGEAEGAGDHQEPSREAGEGAAPKESEPRRPPETPEDTPEPEDADAPLQAESDGHAAGEGRDGEGRQEREPARSPDSPTSPGASDTASPFRKFFAQGWAGWRKKASFRKAREEEPGAAERKAEPEPDGGDAGGREKADDAPGKPAPEAEAEAEQLEPPAPAGQGRAPPGGPCAPLATEVFDEKVEVVAEVHAGPERAEEPGAAAGGPEAPPQAEQQLAEADAAAEPPGCVPAGDPARPPEAAAPEGIAGEAERLAAQERARAQGSPLKKLFSSTGLKKLSGRRQRAKEPGEQPAAAAARADSPDSPDEPRGGSSASSPEEPEEPAGLERGSGAAEAPPAEEAAAEEGAASDGEKRREGVTPWASFKKMVTPKRRARRPSESDKEEEPPEKAKSATLSSAESAASAEAPAEGRGPGDEPKPPPEEPRRKADASVSWEALICVGSSKKRARKASSSSSSSDEEEAAAAPKPAAGEGQRPEGAGQDHDAGPEAGQGSPSPEQAGSPSEGEGGVSTWESFKRLVTPRKRPKCKAEERPDDAGAAEPPAAEAEPGREEAWVSIRKLIPGRRRKRPEGRADPAAAGGAGPADAHDEDADVPAVVPLAEFDAAEREKREAREAAPEAAVSVPEGLSRGLVHTVAVAVVDGPRAVTDMEERSPSWISASAAARPPDRAPEEARPPAAGASERGGAPAAPESRDAGEDTGAGGAALPAGAVPAAEPPEAAEAPGAAEEAARAVPAVSQPSESPDTTEEATPVPEAEGGEPDAEGQERRTQEVLRAAAKRVGEASQLDVRGPGATRKVEARRLPGVAEAEEEAPVGEAGVAVRGRAGEAETEGPGQAAPEHAEGEPQVPAAGSGAATELPTPRCAETLAGAKPELVLEPAETLADSEASASTPVADCAAACAATQQDTATGVHAAEGAGAKPQGGEAQAVPAPRETPPAPSGLRSPEEKKEHAESGGGGPERTGEDVPLETAPVLAKAGVTGEAGQFADEEPRDAPSAEGLGGVSAGTDVTASQKKTAAAALRDGVTEEADGQRNEETELQGPAQAPAAPEERETAGPAEREEAEAAAAHAREEEREPTPGGLPGGQLAQTVHAAVVDGEKEVTRLEESSACLVQGQMLCADVQVQSPEAALPLAAVALEEQVLGETVQLFEAARPWAPAEARVEPEAEPPGGEGAGAGLGAEQIASQGGKSEEGREQVSGQGVGVSETGEEGLKGEEEISQLKTESQKLVQNVIRTAVGQLASTEDTAADGQPPAPPTEAGQQGAEQGTEKGEGEPRGPAEAEAAAPGQSALTPGGQGPSDVPKGARAAAEEAADAGVPGSRVDGQQREELPLPAQDKREATGTRSEPEFGDHAHGLGERAESDPQEKERRDAADYPENQISALVDPEASGDLTKECPDANGPKLKEKEAGLQAEKGQSAPEKEIKTQTPEEAQEQERQPSTPELAES